jgi:hypothetical protein
MYVQIHITLLTLKGIRGWGWVNEGVKFCKDSATLSEIEGFIPTDTWRVLPVRGTQGQPDVLLTPDSPRAKYEQYRDAWQLLKR